MVVVFTSFVLDTDPTIKMLAVGMAVAVLIDASVVRMVLVPAVMSILGDRAWWLPRWLDRIIPDLQLEGAERSRPSRRRPSSRRPSSPAAPEQPPAAPAVPAPPGRAAAGSARGRSSRRPGRGSPS